MARRVSRPTLLLLLLLPALAVAFAPGARAASGAACAPSARSLPGSLPAAELGVYALLRRGATPQDAPSLPLGVSSLAELVGGGLASYDPGEVRLVAAVPGGRAYLVAGRSRSHLPAACLRVLPTGEARYRSEELRQVGAGPAFALVEVSTSGVLSLSYAGFARIATGFELVNVHPVGGQAFLFGLVPDGVGAVSFSIGSPSTAILAPVLENVYTARAPASVNRRFPRTATPSPARLRRLFERLLPPSVTWLSAPDRAALRFFARPPRLAAELAHLAYLALHAVGPAAPG